MGIPVTDQSIKLLLITGDELTALQGMLRTAIEAGGDVDQLRHLLALHDSLTARVAAFDQARADADEFAAEAFAAAQREGKDDPEWYRGYEYVRALGTNIHAWQRMDPQELLQRIANLR